MHWLAAKKTGKMKEDYGWSYISRGKVLGNLRNDLDSIADQPELTHDKSFMMGMMDEWVEEFPPFREYVDHEFKIKKTSYFNSSSEMKAVLLEELRKELFHPTDQDNKDSTQMLELEKLGVVDVTHWVV